MQRRSVLKALGALAASLVVSRLPKLAPPEVHVVDHHAEPVKPYEIVAMVHDEIVIKVRTRDIEFALADVQRRYFTWDFKLPTTELRIPSSFT